MSAHETRAGRGARIEDAARRFLAGHGLRTVARNHRCRFGEIDLVLRDGDTLVFAEVRFRARDAWVGAAESVDAAKQRRLRAAAEHFLMRHPEHAERVCRFDVVAVTGTGGGAQVDWIKDAF